MTFEQRIKKWRYFFITPRRLNILSWTKILSLIIRPKSEASGREILVLRSWLLYMPAGLIEIHPHMEYQLATITIFRRVLYAVFFLQLQCKKFNAYNITDHLTFCCCRNPGQKSLSRENIWQKQNQSTLPVIRGRKHFPTVSSWIKCFYK